MRDVVVIGGGISGLAGAHRLVASGLDVTVLERQERVGGNAVSERREGFLMEHGPSTLNAAFAPAMAFLRELGLERGALDLGAGVRKRYLRDETGLHGISVAPTGFLASPYLSVRAKLSLLGEILRPPRRDGGEESIHAFAARRFGREFADKVIEPMAAGIFMGASRELSVGGAFPKLVEMERRYGSVLRAVLAARRGSEPGRRLFSWRDGVATLPRALAAGLGGRIRCGVTVTGLHREGAGLRIATARHGELRARAVVLAVQPHVAAAICERIDPEGAAALSAIAAPPIAVVFLGYRREQVAHPLDGLGFLSTLAPDHPVSGAQFPSTMFAGRAPAGHVAVSCYVGGARRPDLAGLEQGELAALVHAELAGLLGIRGAPVHVRTRHWARGLPQYTLGHGARRRVAEAAPERVDGLYLTGNYLSGVSVTSCLEQAAQTARAVARDLGAGQKRGGAAALSA